ncbi:lipopolysaccharide transport periplasmic protein LptA [Marinimicrobium sp. C6131]|uniref:lipopolysaccharide transport periplasmic protein LptA n=1 Tax=Marinimicrobium sp. C6131 TaxID=3022676 RepID=UPI00223CB048|nr:lipopolysaccharide transport periplasmic protein LptA [Marinimicrobium sp. C6131]UZJ44819.1 lipopolysaccharide transport periplasmic protein LptA [Marinimicrobium sp. C6131]
MNHPKGTDIVRRARHLALLTLLGALLAPAVAALPDDQQQPIYIESDRAERDGQKGIMLYEGDVRLRQGSLNIRAERLVVHTDTNQQVQRVVAEGTPAHFEQQPDVDDQPVAAQAHTIRYDVASEHLELLTNARIEQGSATMSGNRIDYDMASEILKAEGDTDTDRPRIEMVLPPQSDRAEQD